ncbi:hypothetical protein N7453_008235 [Penicillium expansum]|nr:hypothetical protein N7453_008235 [Penicillium expansum]
MPMSLIFLFPPPDKISEDPSNRTKNYKPVEFAKPYEDNGLSNDESGSGDSESELIQHGLSGSGEEELYDNRDELQRQAEHDPFPEPVDLFPAEDEDQADDQVGYEARNAQADASRGGYEDEAEEEIDTEAGEEPRNAQDDASGNGSEYEDEEGADDQAGEEAIDARDNASEDESEYEDEEDAEDEEDEEETGDHPLAEIQNHSTPTQQITNADALEAQILESVPMNQKDSIHISRVSANAQESQNASSQLQEVPETPTIQSARPNQDHRSTRSDIFTWLTETTKESGFKDTWEAIRRIRKALKAHADPFTKEHFRGIIKLIERLRGLFETMAKDPASASPLKNQCSLIANSIFKENQWIVYTEAPEDEDDGAHLVNQLEAHIVPRLIDLIILGFKTYKTINDQGARHFCIILDLLWGSCDRISSLAQMHYDISGGVMAHSKLAMRHVKTLKDALKDGRLRETPHREDRYIDIKCDNTIGGQLSERILQDIQGQAVKLGLVDR